MSNQQQQHQQVEQRRRRQQQGRRKRLPFFLSKPLEFILVIFLLITLLLVIFSYQFLFELTSTAQDDQQQQEEEGGGGGGDQGGSHQQPQHPLPFLTKGGRRINDSKPKGQQRPRGGSHHQREEKNYVYWRRVAVHLAQLPPSELLQTLNAQDPFQVRTFEQQLLQEETNRGRILTLSEIRHLFPCPTTTTSSSTSSSSSTLTTTTMKHRITLPDQRNETRAQEFRNGHGFLFFQHLRKAGGTNFCTLAEHNLPRAHVPSYYCMPDMHWPQSKGAGYLHHWSNEEILHFYHAQHFRVAGNEWDNFDRRHHWDLPAVFVTSFRRPLDRALSQFRFECLEGRGCPIQNVTKWWERRPDLANVYVQTFADPETTFGLLGTFRGISRARSDASQQQRRGELVGTALDTIAQFHLITVMEWLAYAGPLVTRVLGFQDTSQLTQRVRPHIRQAPRKDDGLDHNVLGARAVIQDASSIIANDQHPDTSWKSKEMLAPELHRQMSEDLALDEILTDAARRIFLEHLVCQEEKEEEEEEQDEK
ncbi:hypothetical protein ACA910_001514 [Epithemia clementina (nom. ined.)]